MSASEVADPSFRGVWRVRDFRLLLIGNVVSQLGTWTQYVGVGWAASGLTESEFVVAATFASQFFPSLVLSPFAGVVADRFDRRRLVIAGNIAMALPPLAIGLLISTDQLTIGRLIALVSAGGVALALSQPASSALVPNLVTPVQIPSAVAANTGSSNLMRILGPGVGGFVIRTWGTDWSFYLNAASFAAVVTACLMIRTPTEVQSSGPEPFGTRLRAGFAYARSNRIIMQLLLVTLVTGTLTMHAPLMPVIARDLLDGDVGTYAQLSTTPGIGAVIASLVAPRFMSHESRTSAIAASVLAIGVAVSIVAVSRSLPLSLLALALYGFGFFVQFTLAATMIIDESADEFRGRVIGLAGTLSVGTIPVGALTGGALAAVIGVPWTVGLCGAGLLTFGARLVLTDPIKRRSAPAVRRRLPR